MTRSVLVVRQLVMTTWLGLCHVSPPPLSFLSLSASPNKVKLLDRAKKAQLVTSWEIKNCFLLFWRLFIVAKINTPSPEKTIKARVVYDMLRLLSMEWFYMFELRLEALRLYLSLPFHRFWQMETSCSHPDSKRKPSLCRLPLTLNFSHVSFQ